MIIKLNNPLKLFVLAVSATLTFALVPQQVDARGGHRGGGHGGGGARSSVNRGGGANRNANRNTNVNRNKNTNINNNRNVNVNKNVNVDVDVDHRRGCCGHGGYHPVATGVAIGVTAAVIGSVVYSLPSGCTTVIRAGISYRQCGSTWYEPRYSGNDVTYVVIEAP